MKSWETYCICYIYGTYMFMIRPICGIYMAHIWIIYEIYMWYVGNIYVSHMLHIYFIYNLQLYMEHIWNIYGAYMKCIWSIYEMCFKGLKPQNKLFRRNNLYCFLKHELLFVACILRGGDDSGPNVIPCWSTLSWGYVASTTSFTCFQETLVLKTHFSGNKLLGRLDMTFLARWPARRLSIGTFLSRTANMLISMASICFFVRSISSLWRFSSNSCSLFDFLIRALRRCTYKGMSVNSSS